MSMLNDIKLISRDQDRSVVLVIRDNKRETEIRLMQSNVDIETYTLYAKALNHYTFISLSKEAIDTLVAFLIEEI